MAARTRYAPDRGLTVRMTATMFLLGLVFVAFIAAIIGIGTAYGASSSAIVLFAVILGGGFAIGSLFYSDKIALATAGAREVSPTDSPEAARLHGIVDRRCALADMPTPRVAIADTDMPNAFATRGLGMSASAHSRSTMPCRRAASSDSFGLTSRAPAVASAILSE